MSGFSLIGRQNRFNREARLQELPDDLFPLSHEDAFPVVLCRSAKSPVGTELRVEDGTDADDI